ncbi:MAG TPA: nuclear transport factor 2 family protein [Gemmatimonadaceae bacterium]|jgi:hypothetical protein|nr:nuclear transport factor 2 family protein [Gemmatimonadaceae bacterium]
MTQSMSDVERLVAINEIREVMARYARHADHKEFEDLAGLFTPDGTFTPHKVDGSVWMHMEGRDGIATTISESVGNAQVLHQLFSYETEVLSPTSATSVVSMADMLIRPEGEAVASNDNTSFKTMRGYGHYHGDFVKVDGRWYIKTLVQTRLKMEFTR